MITPREYQTQASDSVFEYYESGNDGNPIIAAPTGTGKSIIIADFVYKACTRYPGTRIVILTHVKELIVQNFQKLLALWPTAPTGIYSAGLNRKEIAQVTFAGIASVVRHAEAFGHIDLVLIDECHRMSPKEGSMYQSFIKDLKAINENVKVIGLTATKYRMGQGLLTDDGLFTDVCIDMTTVDGFNWFIDEGYLSKLIAVSTRIELDVTGVATQNGDYNQKQLQEKVDKAEITRAALREALQRAQGRNHWLVFGTGIEHVEHITSELVALGISAACVHSKQPEKVRDENIKAFLNGEITALVNNGILTTGFDFALIDLIVVLRPTQSPGLWVQMLGRGTRAVYALGFAISTAAERLAAIAAGPKPNCLVLDFAGNTRRLGPINDPVLPRKKGKGGGTAPVKVCESCGVYCHASVRECPECHYIFPTQVRFKATPSQDELIRRPEEKKEQIETFDVENVTYERHQKRGGLASLRVRYSCGLRSFVEWLCFEHDGYVKHRAREWWRQHTPRGNPPPETVNEALQRVREIVPPRTIKVDVNSKFMEVKAHGY